MAMDKGRALPKFGEWDVKNPASAEGFTVIFNKARDEKKINNNPVLAAQNRTTPVGVGVGVGVGAAYNHNHHDDPYHYQSSKSSKKWFCWG